ncbi:MAG: SPOR domain-containing protein [Legionella sp.]|nr:SPOR domain-containing protein [Legionella sp.]
MANYPNKKSNTRRPPGAVARRPSNKRFFMGIFLAFLGGYALACFYSPVALKTFFEPKPGVFQPTPTTAAAVLPKPKFEFYTLLTQEKGVAKPIPVVAAAVIPIQLPDKTKTPEIAKASKLSEPTSPTSKHTYMVQLASFQRQEDAEQMKAALILRGFDASIKSITQQGGVWHRVVMGPFVSRQTAEKIQASIAQSEHVSGIIRRMDA